MTRRYLAFAAIVAAGFTVGCSGPPEEYGVLVDGERLPVVDVHLHTGKWENMPPAFQDRVSERMPGFLKWTMGYFTNEIMLSKDGILGQLDGAGIAGGGVFALYSPHTTGIATDEDVSELVMESPERLYGFASIRVDDWNNDSAEQLARFEKALALPGIVGVKLAHAHQQFRLDDERFYSIYEVAGRLGKPMYLHTGTSPNPGTRFEPPYSDAAYLEDAVKQYPDAVFILGHSGYDSKGKSLVYTDAALDMAARYDNVYLEPGALGARRAEGVLDDYLQRVKKFDVVDKVIYGSDGPQFPSYVGVHLEAFVAGMERNDYTKDDMRAVLAGNFSRVFGIEVPQL